MFERYTERSRQVVVLAQEECRHLHNDYIGTAHLLLGMMREEDSLAGQAISQLRAFSQDDVRDFIGVGDYHEPIGGQIPFTGSAKKALELALREALSLAQTYIGTEHILLGLTQSPGELEDFFTRKLGTQWEEVIRLEVMELLRGPAREAKKAEKEKAETPSDDLEEQSLLKDLLIGFTMWRDDKLNEEGLTDRDEAFVRWVEASRLRPYL